MRPTMITLHVCETKCRLRICHVLEGGIAVEKLKAWLEGKRCSIKIGEWIDLGIERTLKESMTRRLGTHCG